MLVLCLCFEVMAKRTEKTRFSALEAAEICTRRLSDTSDQELSEPESDVSAVDSVEEEMFFEGLDAILDRQNDSDPDWEPDTEVLAEVHVEIDDPELTSVPAAEPEPGPSSKIPRVEKTAKRGRGRSLKCKSIIRLYVYTNIISTLRPDVLLVSESTKNIVIMELTEPWEERLEEAPERKRSKYEQLTSTAELRPGRQNVCPSRLAAEDLWATHSTEPSLNASGIAGTARARDIKNTIKGAEKALR
ncbi:uncharacterized protein LOC129407905 [Boleophthalmus pectinirostris]|uniref:uncharacterized protein LOC129407905 n=1 Tax=Boleophthalmus pectinirostris TaxID=150288 RepID=UPI00242A6D3E|nr:uncharacterized protein LOC129407905 [Boleophthalmus pectinirostris]